MSSDKMRLYDLILKSADYILENEIPAGINGPYNDPETKIRYFSHWLITLLKAYEITKDERYKKRAKGLLDGLFSKEARPYGYTFQIRNKKGKDSCNGLIGQAWVIEALANASKYFNDKRYIDTAKEIYFLEEFNPKSGYWRKCDIDGKIKGYDNTFNHQLWFAASGSMISDGKDKVGKQVSIFMDRLEKNIEIHNNGLIRHLIYAKKVTSLYLLKNMLTFTGIDKKYLYEKEAGYQAFNCYALALLENKYPMHKFWTSEKFKKITEYALGEEHLEIASKNKYGMPYNPSGIELAYFILTFKPKDFDSLGKKALEMQFSNHVDRNILLMNKNTSDPVALAARIYEAAMLPDIEVKL